MTVISTPAAKAALSAARRKMLELDRAARGKLEPSLKVRTMPRWPRSWANFSPLDL
jgi:hypothetical protein